MLSKAINFIIHFSSSGLLGAAHGAHIKGKLSKSYKFSIEGLERSKNKCDAWMWSEFLSLAVEVGLKLKGENIFREIAAAAIAEDCPDYEQEASKPLLGLSMWGYGLGLNELSTELVERAIKADAENAEAWFFSGWSLLVSDKQEAEQRLQRSVALNPTMASRIKNDERCQKYIH
ncbi:hypothetical protein N9383_05840 [Granulosicoccus sp.]|nr:hypothetical protein [Granulosicoccus sp.]